MSADTPYDRLRHFVPENEDLGLDGYEVLGRIGEGGFGCVFKARQPAFERDVAVKILSASGFRDQTARRFERECRAFGALSGHPNIVTIYDGGITRWGRPYIVMEHIAAGSFAQRLAAHGPLNVAQSLDVIVKIAGAVETAHRARILHRDIKPENILLSAYGEPKLTDFGIASIPGDYQTHTGSIGVSLAHAAPEVLEGAKPAPAADVYALGSTLFTLIAGRAPFGPPEPAGLQALIARIVRQPIPDLRAEGAPDEVCTLIERAMAKDASERFASARELAAAANDAQAALGLPATDILLADATLDAADLPVADRPEEATVLRQRRVLTPPQVPLPRRPPRWRSPIAAATAAVLIALGAGGTVALKARRPAASAARQVTGIAPVASPSPTAAPASDNGTTGRDEPRGKSRTRRGRKSATNAGTLTFAGGSSRGTGGGAAAGASGSSTTSSGAGSYSSGAGGSSGSTGGSSGTTSGGSGTSEPKPAPPAPANLLLYHLYSEDGSYYFTTSVSEYNRKMFEYDFEHREAAVWENGNQKMRRICFGDGRCGGWVYIQKPSGIQTRPLYSFTGPYGDYYTTNKSEIPAQYSDRQVYLFGWVQ